MIETQDVIDMANFYEISEFDLFRLAYTWWHGRFPDERTIEGDFRDYMFERKVPFYVRQFVRENPFVTDSGSILEEWLPVLEQLKGKTRKSSLLNVA